MLDSSPSQLNEMGDYLKLVDTAFFINTSCPPILRPERKVDVILHLNYSGGSQTLVMFWHNSNSLYDSSSWITIYIFFSVIHLFKIKLNDHICDTIWHCDHNVPVFIGAVFSSFLECTHRHRHGEDSLVCVSVQTCQCGTKFLSSLLNSIYNVIS